MWLKLNFNIAVNEIVNIYACLLLYFSGCTLLRQLMLVPLAFRKAKLIFDSNDQNFSVFLVKDDSSTYRFI